MPNHIEPKPTKLIVLKALESIFLRISCSRCLSNTHQRSHYVFIYFKTIGLFGTGKQKTPTTCNQADETEWFSWLGMASRYVSGNIPAAERAAARADSAGEFSATSTLLSFQDRAPFSRIEIRSIVTCIKEVSIRLNFYSVSEAVWSALTTTLVTACLPRSCSPGEITWLTLLTVGWRESQKCQRKSKPVSIGISTRSA